MAKQCMHVRHRRRIRRNAGPYNLRVHGDGYITLVNPRPVFVERIRPHQLVAGTGIATVDSGKLFGKSIRPVVDAAERCVSALQVTVKLSAGNKTNDLHPLRRHAGIGLARPRNCGAQSLHRS